MAVACAGGRVRWRAMQQTMLLLALVVIRCRHQILHCEGAFCKSRSGHPVPSQSAMSVYDPLVS